MATITKRGTSWRAVISLYKHGEYKRLSRTFKTKKDAKRWALENELLKGNGTDLAQHETTFADFFEQWVHIVKKKDVRETTFQNHLITTGIVKQLFGDIQIKHLNDLVVQLKIDRYGETHSRKTTTEVLLKIRTSLRYAYARGLLDNDFANLVKTHGKELPKRNKALLITELKLLRKYLLEHSENEFHVLILLAIETGARRGELLGLKKEDIFEYGVKIQRSVSPTSDDVGLKTKNSLRDISINKDVFHLLQQISPKGNGYLFDRDGFRQSARLQKLLSKLGISKTTFHGLRDTHASFLFSENISLDYVSRRLGHNSILTTQNYYLELMPEKKHQHDADALNLLNSLSD
ncbi:site-specific integrase [Enterococcus sp. BWB1-3]|uniref:tyrosine-type recombinase/integrase n=1 Tax=Enterococcus sp. BWB1-3 TaxID=2787713 RepID=UPI001923CCF9|nr:site-specific integrase [Enterococcus sp. BWB1-3]MBL1229303.1 site-specific integrase [Enterococcus sp. BWB1-3]